MLEAINLFLSGQFPRARFVLGLDPEVVAAHIDRTYTDLLATPFVAFPGDRTPGWTFLRKLVQLPVMLPAVTDDGVDRLLDDALKPVDPTAIVVAAAPGDQSTDVVGGRPIGRGGAASSPAASALPPTPHPAPDHQPVGPAPDRSETTDDIDGPVDVWATPPEFVAVSSPVSAPTPAPQQVEDSVPEALPSVAGLIATLEGDPAVRQRLRERLSQQADRSGREIKRVLTVWQFYVRLLERIDPVEGTKLIDRARHLVIVAEIITRWPAQQSTLRATIPAGALPFRFPQPTSVLGPLADAEPVSMDHRRGLQVLAAAAGDDLSWSEAVKIVLPGRTSRPRICGSSSALMTACWSPICTLQ